MGHMIAIVLVGAIGLVLLSASAIWLFQIVAIPLRALYEVIVARDRQKCPTCRRMAVKITVCVEPFHAHAATHECEHDHSWSASTSGPGNKPRDGLSRRGPT
jgi:hypothetical protein